MYNVLYSVESFGIDFFLVITNIDIGFTFRLPIVIIEYIYVVTDYLTAIEYAVIINPDGSVRLMQCWVDGTTVIVEYERQFAILSYSQQMYSFTSIAWVSVRLFG